MALEVAPDGNCCAELSDSCRYSLGGVYKGYGTVYLIAGCIAPYIRRLHERGRALLNCTPDGVIAKALLE